MRRARLALVCFAVTWMAIPTLFAADGDDVFIYATYSKCDSVRSDRADEIVKSTFASVYDEAVEAKKLQAWGWSAHHTGGEWRRLSYFVVPGRDAVLAVTDEINEKLRKDHASVGRQFREICYEHDDYVWRWLAGSKSAAETATKRASAALSTYFVCDSAGEKRADEIVMETMGPLFDAQVKDGRLGSWSWFEHYLGGEYRRLVAMDGESFASVLAARDAMIAAMEEKHPGLMKEFESICGSHQDYLWDIQISRP